MVTFLFDLPNFVMNYIIRQTFFFINSSLSREIGIYFSVDFDIKYEKKIFLVST